MEQREIKFRAWKKTDKTMQVGNFALGANGCIHFSDNDFLAPKFFILMQYTGLKDKNGIEVYEGDIVDTEHGPAKIAGASGYYSVRYLYEDDFGFLSSWSSENQRKNIEVIGNIYENPELLKKNDS